MICAVTSWSLLRRTATFAGGNPNVIKRRSLRPGPEQRRPIAEIARPAATSQTSTATQAAPSAGQEIQLVVGYQLCRLRIASYGKRVRGQQLEKRIVPFLLPVIEGEQPLLELRMGQTRRLA